MFLDEAGFMLNPLVRRTLWPRGYTPRQSVWLRRHRISAISAILMSPAGRSRRLSFALMPDDASVHDTHVVAFLRRLANRFANPLLVIWDRGGIHLKSHRVRTFLKRHPRIRARTLPAYAPELNPVEQVWQHCKYERLANFAAPSMTALRAQVRAELRRLCRRQDLLAAFIRHAGPWL